MTVEEGRGPVVELQRVNGLAAQLLEAICERIDGCLRVESRAGGYAVVFEWGTPQIDAWQRVHSALLDVDPEGRRLRLAEPGPFPDPATEMVGSQTRVSAEPLPPPAGA
jgi:hypothetical protein